MYTANKEGRIISSRLEISDETTVNIDQNAPVFFDVVVNIL